jgi:alanine racemase
VPRRLGSVGGEVLVGGRRVPVAGSVTMDQFVVDCGPDARVAVGDEVVLLGTQGDEVVTAEQWAEALGTIGYEIVTRISTRVPRLYVG